MQGEAKRLLLASLTRSLSEVLPFLERMLEANFAAAGAAVQAGNREAAQQHVLVIQAALAAANTYSGESAGLAIFGGGLGGFVAAVLAGSHLVAVHLRWRCALLACGVRG